MHGSGYYMAMFKRCLPLSLAALVVLAVMGCGVKNDPTHPEGSTFPRVYPTPSAEPTLSEPPPSTSPQRQIRRPAPSGFYEPPPPATQMPR